MEEQAEFVLVREWKSNNVGGLYLLKRVKSDWDYLTIIEQEKLLQRVLQIEIAFRDGRPANSEKVRWLKGDGLKGVAEFKITNPPLRCIGFKDSGNWYVTYVGRKPKERDLKIHGENAAEINRSFIRNKIHGKQS